MSPQLYMSMHRLNNLFDDNVQHQRQLNKTPQYNSIIFTIYEQHHVPS